MPAPPPLIGIYAPPAVRPGDVVRCLYRRADCRVTRWTDAPLAWPRCNQLGIQGGSGLLVTRELVRAIRTESAAALMHWFGVSCQVAWRWRKRFVPGPGKFRTKGSSAAHQKASKVGGGALQAHEWTDAERAARRVRSKRLQLRPPPRWDDDTWTPEWIALLGTMDDEDVAARVGRSPATVRWQRRQRGIPAFRDRRRENRTAQPPLPPSASFGR
jgi:hypothetical protein